MPVVKRKHRRWSRKWTDYGEGSTTFRGAIGAKVHVIDEALEKADTVDDLVFEIDGLNGGSYSVQDLSSWIDMFKAARKLAMRTIVARQAAKRLKGK